MLKLSHSDSFLLQDHDFQIQILDHLGDGLQVVGCASRVGGATTRALGKAAGLRRMEVLEVPRADAVGEAVIRRGVGIVAGPVLAQVAGGDPSPCCVCTDVDPGRDRIDLEHLGNGIVGQAP